MLQLLSAIFLLFTILKGQKNTKHLTRYNTTTTAVVSWTWLVAVRARTSCASVWKYLVLNHLLSSSFNRFHNGLVQLLYLSECRWDSFYCLEIVCITFWYLFFRRPKNTQLVFGWIAVSDVGSHTGIRRTHILHTSQVCLYFSEKDLFKY